MLSDKQIILNIIGLTCSAITSYCIYFTLPKIDSGTLAQFQESGVPKELNTFFLLFRVTTRQYSLIALQSLFYTYFIYKNTEAKIYVRGHKYDLGPT